MFYIILKRSGNGLDYIEGTDMSYQDIKKSINDLKIDADVELMDLLNELHNQLEVAGNAEWDRDELSDFIKSDNDVLDSGVISEDSALWEEIRNIQDSIIAFFGEEKK